MRIVLSLFLVFSICLSIGCIKSSEPPSIPLSAPKLINNPSWDIIATNRRPLLSFNNASGGGGKRKYTIQIDEAATFDSTALIEYRDIPEENRYITSKLVEEKDALKDKTRYYWRVRAVEATGRKGSWAQSRFYLDTESDDSFMNLVRVPVFEVKVSSGQNSKNIIDLDDPGQVTFWQASPPGASVKWVIFDLGKRVAVSRVWMLSNTLSPDGWLKDFNWQISDDGERWKNIPGTRVKNNDTFRNIINFQPTVARYFKLLIEDWHGYSPQLNEVIFYSPGKPPLPQVPENDYVLIIGNQQNGFTFTELEKFIKGLKLNLEVLTVPHYEVSLEMIENLKKKPLAIILSGNNADYQNLPMFEYNGEFEIIRESRIPILGICCGHQLTVMAYGYSYVQSMGWTDISSLEDLKKIPPIRIEKNDPIFEDIAQTFTAPEIHGWAVALLPEDYEVLAFSTYIQAIRSKSRMLYGEQFHAEIEVPYNQGRPYLINFLKMVIKKAGEEEKREGR